MSGITHSTLRDRHNMTLPLSNAEVQHLLQAASRVLTEHRLQRLLLWLAVEEHSSYSLDHIRHIRGKVEAIITEDVTK